MTRPRSSASEAAGVSLLDCPAGVTALDVQRVFYAPGVSTPGIINNVLHWEVLFGLSSSQEIGHRLDAGEVMAVLTSGAPDTVLSRPVRFDLTQTTSSIAFTMRGSTGIPGIPASIVGSLIFEGVPVP